MNAVVEVISELDALCATAMPGGSCRVAVWGPKGGGTRTTTAAAILSVLDGRLVGMLAGVDANPDLRNLTQRLGLGASTVPGRLHTLAQDTSVIRYLADWSTFLDRVGRIHLLHNDTVPGPLVHSLTTEQYRAVFDLLARYAEVQVIDLPQSPFHPSSRAALATADHLVVALPADAAVLRLATDAMDELAAAGHGRLLSRATVVLTVTQQRVKPAAYQQALDYLTGRVGDVQVVPFDRRVGAGFDHTDTAKLAPRTSLAYRKIVRHVLASIRGNSSENPEVIPPESPRQHSHHSGQVPTWQPAWQTPEHQPAQVIPPESPGRDAVDTVKEPKPAPQAILPPWANRVPKGPGEPS